MKNSILKGAFLTILTLFGGLLIGLVAGDVVFRLIPGSRIDDVKLGHAAIAAVPALAGFFAGGACWGVQMGRLAGASDTRRLATAGMLGFGPITIILAAGLGVGESFIVESIGSGFAVHRIFFTVDDNRGGACSGEVRVGVPLSSSQETAVDDGAIYDAASP